MSQFNQHAIGSCDRRSELTAEQIRRARLTLARAAADADELAEWLAMLGIGPENGNEEAV
ncbi:MAG: hypothetical protein ACRDMV_05750 [Streptosporangiales bacterium]